MMIEKLMKVYQCIHCKKRMFGKGAMSRHERLCNSNPINWRACSNCIHCEKVEFKYKARFYDSEIEPYGEYERYGTTFKCKIFGKMMYPFVVEKKELPKRFPETFINQEPMPKSCEKREQNKNRVFDDFDADY